MSANLGPGGTADTSDAESTFSGDYPLPNPAEPLRSDGGELIHLQFLARAAERPDAPALVDENGTWTYGNLELRSRSLAHRLSRAGAGIGSRVAILAARGPELVCAMLAVSRLGGVFIVLDSAYPEARLRTLVDIASPQVFITTTAELAHRAQPLAEARGAPVVEEFATAETVDEPLPHLLDAHADAPAYFLFTSGSTGVPKCVAASHRPLTHFVRWHTRTFKFTRDDTFTMLAGLSHDPLMRDVFTPLSLGARLAIPRQTTITEPGALTVWFKETRATVSHLTPAMGQLLVAGASKVERLRRLRYLFWGGDRLPLSLVHEVAKLAPTAEHVNFYGSTETPQAAAYFRHDGREWGPSMPIGKGTEDFQILLVDDERRPVRRGEDGEVAVRSNYLSLGYVRDGVVEPADDRGADAAGVRNIYFTGDRGKYLPDGGVMLLGRADDQIKIRGYRVDLAEITAALQEHAAIAGAATVWVGEGAAVRVVSFVSPKAGAHLDIEEIRSWLTGAVPSYMVPNAFEALDALPLLPNGKVDRQALRARAEAGTQRAVVEGGPAPQNEAERAIIEKWSSLFGAGLVTRDVSFAALGGDSLSYVQAFIATESVVGVVPADWPQMTIAELAQSATEKSKLWTVIDSPMLIRAAAISLVVAGHTNLLVYGDGATTSLFMVSGFLFGGLQIKEAFRRGSAAPIFRSLRNIVVPVFLFSAFAYFWKALRDKPTSLHVLFMNNDLIDYLALEAKGINIVDFQAHLWYVDALLKLLLLSGMLIWLFRRTKLLEAGPFKAAFALFVVGLFGRFVLSGLIDPRFFEHGFTPKSIVAHSPTTHLSTFMLGIMVATADTRQRKMLVLALLLAYGVATYQFFGPWNAGSVTIAGVALLFLGRIKVPKPVASLAFLLAGASLFIYMPQFMLSGVAHKFVGNMPVVQWATALVGGVALWWGWTQFNIRLNRFIGKPKITGSAVA